MGKKKIFVFICFFAIVFTSFSYAFYPTLPKDLGSNSEILELLNLKEDKTIIYDESYVISCVAEPGTEVTLYEKYDATLYVPLTRDNESITGVVGESGLLLLDLTLRQNSTKQIMFFAEKGSNYQTIFKTISVKEKVEKEFVQHEVLNISNFVSSIYQ